MGVTLQILNSQLDGGSVIDKRTVPIQLTDTWHRLERRAYETGLDMLAEACSAISRDAATPIVIPPEELGELYTLPNFRQWSALHGKVLVRRTLAACRPTAGA
jgi:methionyl-tRNA formyltransferase